MTLKHFIERINNAQPLSPVAMYYLGIVTATFVEAEIEPDGRLFDAVLLATDRQTEISRHLTAVVMDVTQEWVEKKPGKAKSK